MLCLPDVSPLSFFPFSLGLLIAHRAQRGVRVSGHGAQIFVLRAEGFTVKGL